MKANELRIGNLIYSSSGGVKYVVGTSYKTILHSSSLESYTYYEDYDSNCEPIPLTEEWLLKLCFSVITEKSVGKRYGYVINGIFSSDLTFIFWKTTKESGKFFRGDLELKSVHQLQNLYFALTNEELTLNNL